MRQAVSMDKHKIKRACPKTNNQRKEKKMMMFKFDSLDRPADSALPNRVIRVGA